MHLYSKPQSHQASYYALHQNGAGKSNINNMVAFMDFQANLADQHTARSFLDRIPISDMLIELTGRGKSDDGSGSSEWDDNWGTVYSEFWIPQRQKEDQYWYEHVYWNHPHGASGYAYGEKVQNNPNQGSGHGTYLHEMGHNYGSGHENFGERYAAVNAMRHFHSSSHASIVHQGLALDRRKDRTRSGKNQEFDLRIPAEHNWNYHPLAQPDHTSIYRNESVNVDVLKNDSDPNGDMLSVTHVEIYERNSTKGGADSIIRVNSDNTIYFEPPKGFVGLIEGFYVLSDNNGLTSRGIIHFNVEQNGISDVFTLEEECIPEDNYEHYDKFTGTQQSSKLSIREWGYKSGLSKGETVGCEFNTYSRDPSNAAQDIASDFQLVQSPFHSGETGSGEIDKNESHPHLFEINDKDFSVSFEYLPRKDIDLDAYSELARRGRMKGNGWDYDGWVIAARGESLLIEMHEKSKFAHAERGLFTLEVKNLPELKDTDNWQQVAMTLDWDTREVSAYLNGVKVGSKQLPDTFTLVSTSGGGYAYGRGAYASFGQTSDATNEGQYTTLKVGGIDDIIIAHEALSEEQINDIYMNVLPAHNAKPLNGSALAVNNVEELSWMSHYNMKLQLAEYKVYLSTDEELVLNSDASALISQGSLDKVLDVSSLNLNGNDYYWKVDSILFDGSVVEGEVWSFFEEPIKAFSLRRLQAEPEHVHEPVEYGADANYEGDTKHFEDDYNPDYKKFGHFQHEAHDCSDSEIHEHEFRTLY